MLCPATVWSWLILMPFTVVCVLTLPSWASRMESDLMSRWITPLEWRNARALRQALHTVAIWVSSILKYTQLYLWSFIDWRFRGNILLSLLSGWIQGCFYKLSFVLSKTLVCYTDPSFQIFLSYLLNVYCFFW